MRLILNVIWLVLAGFWMALGYALAAVIMFILIITIPFGVAALRIGVFALWPFGKTVIRRGDAGAGSISIPLGLANFKLIPVTLTPFGRDIVTIEEAELRGLAPQVVVPARR